jgi:hypothetical protein
MKTRLLVRADQYNLPFWFSSHFTEAPEGSQPEPATVDPIPGPDEANDEGDAEEGEGPKILSKKEKERLKKEKEKVNHIILCTAVASDCPSLSRQRKRLRRLRRRPNLPKRRQQ